MPEQPIKLTEKEQKLTQEIVSRLGRYMKNETRLITGSSAFCKCALCARRSGDMKT